MTVRRCSTGRPRALVARRARRLLGLVAALALLAAGCGDDGDDPAARPADGDETATEATEADDGTETADSTDAVDGDDAGDVDASTQLPDMPEVEGPLTGPGDTYLDPLEANFPDPDTAEEHGYVFDDYLVSGTAAGAPYQVRAQIARPGDSAAPSPSGHAIVEAIHPQGIPFVWNFTREYLMAQGHVAVNLSLYPGTIETLQGANAQRYGDLQVTTEDLDPENEIAFDHASEVYAQVGAWLKSEQSPLPDLEWLHMTGHSRSVGPVWQYMDTHHGAHRLEGDEPIYDSFFPETTRTASRMGAFPEVDVPTLLINSELEVEMVLVEEGIDYRRPDSDEPGEQFRLYEVAGMPHNLTWRHPLVLDTLDIASAAAERCANPLNDFPYNPTISMALDHLLRWVEDDVPPPRAEPIEIRGEPGEDGAAIVRDEHGNAVGGVRSATLDVPVATHLGLNEPVDDDEDIAPGGCLVYGSQLDFPPEELETLYGDQEGYVDQVDQRIDELFEEGWILEQFTPELRRRAEQFDGFPSG